MKEKLQVMTVAVLFFGLSVFAWAKPADEISDSELRRLAQLPELTAVNVLSGDFMADFEQYTLDQFPMRERFRGLKAFVYLYALRQLDNNGIYIQDDFAVKMEYPLNEEAIDYACGRFRNIYDNYLEGTQVHSYLAVIPDKNYFLADAHGALKLDYEELFYRMREGTGFAAYIDITDCLSAGAYYRTDTHWNQIYITDAAKRLAEGMGAELDHAYELTTLAEPFYGVYYGQAALPMAPDRMQYLTNSAIRSARVYDWQNGGEIPVYDEEKLATRSPYDLFLGGSLSLITIENPGARTDKELIIFRDSFGSSIAPLLVSGYKKITLVDIRYLSSDRLGAFITFTDQDVLFLYSTLVLNNSSTLK